MGPLGGLKSSFIPSSQEKIFVPVVPLNLYIQMEELFAVKELRQVLGAIMKDTGYCPNTRPWVCDGSQLRTSNETALLRSMTL